MFLSTPDVEIFTDGSFNPKSGMGGWAYVVMEQGRSVHSVRGGDRGGSNNTFEVMAVVEALYWVEASAPSRSVSLWTDSVHVVEGCERWRAIWRNNGWKRVDHNPRVRRRKIPDALLWQKLDALLTRNPDVKVAWCKAHSGIIGNEYADTLARALIAGV